MVKLDYKVDLYKIRVRGLVWLGLCHLDLSNNPKTKRVYSLMLIVDIEKKKKQNIK